MNYWLFTCNPKRYPVVFHDLEMNSINRWMVGVHKKGIEIGDKVAFWILFGVYYREHLSGIRIYPSEILRSQKWKYSGFEGDHEKAAVLLKENYRVKLAPIRYQPRTVKEGKKIRASDGFKAILVFLLIRIKSSK